MRTSLLVWLAFIGILGCQGCGGSHAAVERTAGEGGRQEPSGGTAGQAGSSDLGQGGSTPQTGYGCESLQCIDGRVQFSLGCPGAYTTCEPNLNDGVECVPSGPCPNAAVISEVDCEHADTTTEPTHCGACDQPCPPSILELDSNLSYPEIAADDTYVYWAHRYSGWIKRVPATGGAPVTIYGGAANIGLGAMAVHSGHVYWADHSSGTGLSSVWTTSVSGSAPSMIATDQTDVRGIAVDGATVCWITGDRAVVCAPVAGGTPTILARSVQFLLSIAVDANDVYWSTNAVEAAEVGVIMKQSVGDGTPILLAEIPNPGASALIKDDQNLYWRVGDSIYKLPKAGGTPTVLASQLESPVSLAVDDTHVYWTSLGNPTAPVGLGGSVKKVSIAGGSVTTLASRLGNPWNIAVSGKRVAWGQDYADDRILSIDKDPCRGGMCVTSE